MKSISKSLLLLVLAAYSSAYAADRPNIVFIITDDQSWDSLGFMGGDVHTPRLDQMAKDGLYLSNFNVTSTVCSPSRYSFLTGRFAGRCEGQKFMHEHPLGDQTQVENIGELEPHRWNIAKILQKNGYRTGFVGKSHVIRHDWLHTNRNKSTADEMGWPQDADPRDPKTNALMGAKHKKWCDEIKKYGFDYADGVYAANLKELHCDALNAHNLDWSIDKTFEFLDSRDQRPFFLCVSTTLHHGPAPWVNRFSLNADSQMTGEGFVSGGFNVLPSRTEVLNQNRMAGFQDKQAYAYWLDLGVGAIIDKVKQLGLAKETLIAFVPDHGSYRHGKTTLHDFGMRVPMLCYWPGTIDPGSKCDELVANIDFAPTVLDICGITPPRDYEYDGLSFKPMLLGDHTPVREALFGEMGHSRCIKTKAWKYIAVRYPPDVQAEIDKGHKFNAFAGQPKLDRPYLTRNGHLGYHASNANPHYFESDQLYDLRIDAEENHNVVNSYPSETAELQSKLSTELRKFPGRPFGEFTTQSVGAPKKVTPSNIDTSTLDGKVMVGYQGWFNCKDDGMQLGWTHWSRNRRLPGFGPGNVSVDLWPDISELDHDERYPTEFRNADGTIAEVFSSSNRKTVIRHFKWMQDYGIDGAFVQRFANGLSNPELKHHKDTVLRHARDGAQQHGRVFSIMYDLTGMKAGSLDQVLQDWKSLQAQQKLTGSKAYLHHKGKPLVAVWGIGFDDRHKGGGYTLSDCEVLITGLKDAGCSVLLGVPTGWREQVRDVVRDSDLHKILRLGDVLSPWTPGRYRNPKEVTRHADQYWRKDVQWCNQRDQDYIPVVFPGFSWHNMKGAPLDQIPRLKGEFLWSQITAAKRSGCKMLYIAMFDEVDEGTAIFKCTNTPPVGKGVSFLTYEDLPSDHYLKIAREAGKLFRGEIEAIDKLPKMNKAVLSEHH